jgi:hypothetical protein
MAAEALAIERGVAAEQVAAAEGLAARPKRKRRATTRPGKGRWRRRTWSSGISLPRASTASHHERMACRSAEASVTWCHARRAA